MGYMQFMVEKYCAAAENKACTDYLRYGIKINVPYFLIKSETSFYIWRTQEDAKVRPSHRDNNGKVFERAEMPPTLHPGMAPNCRCWAEAVIASFPSGMERFIKMDKVKTWPDLPINGPFKVELASKNKPRKKNQVSIYDQYGGEWRPHFDRRHNIHWDYKAEGRCSRWINIPINNQPTNKGINYVKNKMFS